MSAARRRELAAACALLAAALFAYAGTLSGPFVFDDRAAIERNKTLRSLWPPWDALRGPGYGNALAGRPLANFSFALTRALFGGEPRAERAVNLALHVACGGLAALALRRLLRLPRAAPRSRERAGAIAFVTALLFTLHPLASEVVLYAVQRTELLAALFALLATLFFLRSLESARAARWQAGAVAACAAGMACKETLAVLPLLLLLCDRAFAAGSLRAALAARARCHTALASTWLIPAALLASAPRGRSIELFSGDYLLAQGGIGLDYLRLVVWPDPLVFDYGPLVPGQAALLPALALAALALGAALWGLRAPRSGFAALWWFGWLAPSSSLVAVLAEVGAERRVYLALVGPIAIGAAGALELGARVARRLRLPSARARAAGCALLLLVALAFGLRIRARAADFRSELSLWQSAAAARPTNPRAWFNLGNHLRESGRAEQASHAYLRSLSIEESYVAHLNLGALLAQMGQPERAGAHLARAVEIEPLALYPRAIDARLNLAAVLAAQGRLPEARREIEIALARDPRAGDRVRLADALHVFGEPERALEALRPLLERMPPDADAAALAGRIRAQKKR